MTVSTWTILLPLWLALLATGEQPTVNRFEYARPKMGTAVRMILYADRRAVADRAADKAYARIDQLAAILSDYNSRSELSRLSASSRHGVPGTPTRVSDDLFVVLDRSVALSAQTGGAFDVTVGPYVRLWRRARQQRRLPSPARLAAARQSVGYQQLELDRAARTVRLRARGMRLDLGGIAKGYAADEALKVIRSAGITRALVDAGGDLITGAAPPGQAGWRVALIGCETGPPNERPLLHIANQAIATSGATYRYVELNGTRYSHILDPRTGMGITGRRIVSVCAPDCMTADGVASAVSVLGVDRGLALAARLPGVSVRICDRATVPPTLHMSTGFPR